MQDKIQAIRAKVAECIALAEKTYGITMPALTVRFDLTGRAAGMAGMRFGAYYLRFNTRHMALGGKTWEHLLNDTVPHEVAHSVCQAFPKFGHRHNDGWKRVCRALGGNGQRCYSEEDAPEAVAAQRPYVYTTSSGLQVRVTPVIHRKIQGGSAYLARDRSRISSACEYSVAGSQVHVAKPTAPTVTRATPAVVRAPEAVTKPLAGGSNAERIRTYLAQSKRAVGSEALEQTVQWAVATLGMKSALARTYVKNNWDRC